MVMDTVMDTVMVMTMLKSKREETFKVPSSTYVQHEY